MQKGVFDFEVGGVQRGFKFGTYAMKVACEMDGCVLSDLMKRIGLPYDGKDDQGNAVKISDPVNLTSLLHFFYGAAVHYKSSKKEKVDFDVVEVSDWIDEIGYEKIQEVLVSGLTQYLPKNSESLTEIRETVTP